QGRPACLCRKPAPGLLTRAARMHGFELGRSWMIARSLDEVEAGHRAGCRSLLLGDDAAAGAGRRSPLRLPDALAQDWQAAVHLLRQPAAAGLQPGLACEAGAWAA
ncbi:MAG: HAD hydrolase-like protein, partial [Burkholderiaceae bacterium]